MSTSPLLIYSSRHSLQCPRPRQPPSNMPFPYVGPPTPPQEQEHSNNPLSAFDHHRPPPDHPTPGSNLLIGRSSYYFTSSRSRVIRIFNLPKDPSFHLASLFYPATLHSPLTLWSVREEYGGPPPGSEDSVWAVFKSHDQASAALGLSGGTVSVATALEADLEPFQKLRKLDLKRHSLPTVHSPQQPSASHLPSSASHSRITELSPLGNPTKNALDQNQTSPDEFAFTLSSNPPNPRNTFRQGDWICTSLNCAAHNFMRNMVCIGCGSPRPVAGPSSAAPNCSFSLPWPRVVSSPRFGGVPPSEFINGSPHSNDFVSRSDTIHPLSPHTDLVESHPTFIPPSPLSAVTPQRVLPKVPSLPSLPSGTSFTSNATFSPSRNSFSTSNGPPFSPTCHSFSQAPTSFSPAAPSFSSSSLSPVTSSFPTTSSSSSSSSSTINVSAAAVALKLPSILTPSGRAFSIGGKVQNVSSDPLAPCVLYWPDNEPWPEQDQMRPPGSVGAQPPPIMNTGNRGPIERQPGDWVCRKCKYLNWRRRKVCQTCFPYAEGNTDGVSASVQAERIAMLAQVLGVSHAQSAQGSQQLFTTQSEAPQLLIHTNTTQQLSHSHSIPTPPNDTVDYLYRSPASPATSSPGSEYLSWHPGHGYGYTNMYAAAPGPSLGPGLSPGPGRRPLPPPSFLDEDISVPSPATPPSSIASSSPHSARGSVLRREESEGALAFTKGSSIWALKKEEVASPRPH